jgi:hypothetical protein
MQSGALSTKIAKPLLLVALIGLLALVGGAAYLWFSGGSGQAS